MPGCARRKGPGSRHHRDAARGRRAAGGRPPGGPGARPPPARRRRVPACGRPPSLRHGEGQGLRPARVRPGPRGCLQERPRRRVPPRRDARRQVHVAPAASSPAPDAGRHRHHRQPRFPDPVGQPGHPAAGAGPRSPVAVGAGSAVIQMDGTPVRAGRHPGKPGSMRKGHLWPVPGDRGGVVLPFADSSRHGNAARFPGNCSGALVTDGHRAYEAHLAARGGAVTHQACWAHTRRNFRELRESHPETAGEALDLTGAVYGTGRETARLPAPERLAARRTRSRAAVAAFRDWRRRTPGIRRRRRDTRSAGRSPTPRSGGRRWRRSPPAPTCRRTRTWAGTRRLR